MVRFVCVLLLLWLSIFGTTPLEATESLEEMYERQLSEFNDETWLRLVEQHRLSPCRDDLSYACIATQIFSFLDLNDYNDAFADLSEAAQNDDYETINHVQAHFQILETLQNAALGQPGDAAVAEALLSALQNANLDAKPSYSIPLVFAAGHVKEGKALLKAQQAETQNGQDYGVIGLLVQLERLDEAFEIAKFTERWRNRAPDPRVGSTAIMHCYTYAAKLSRINGLNQLSQAFAGQQRFAESLSVARMIAWFLENDADRQTSYCHAQQGQAAYAGAMTFLGRQSAEAGRLAFSSQVFEEQRRFLKKNIKFVDRFAQQLFEDHAKAVAVHGDRESLAELAEYFAQNQKISRTSTASLYESEPVSTLLALSGRYDEAIRYLEEGLNVDTVYDRLFRERALNLLKKASTPDVQLTSHIAAAKALAQIGDKEGARIFAQKAESLFSERRAGYDPVENSVADYVNVANVYYDIDDKAESRRLLGEILDKVNSAPKSTFRRGSMLPRTAGRIALLYIKHEPITEVQAWSDNLATYYDGFYYAQVAAWLVREERWSEFDAYILEAAEVLSLYQGVLQNWQQLVDSLITKGEYERYLRFADLLNEGTPETKARMLNQSTGSYPSLQVKTDSTRQQHFLIRHLLSRALHTQDVPDQVLHDIWPRYINSCRQDFRLFHRSGEALPTPEETMAACYTRLLF